VQSAVHIYAMYWPISKYLCRVRLLIVIQLLDVTVRLSSGII